MRVEKPSAIEEHMQAQQKTPVPQPLAKVLFIGTLCIVSSGLFWYLLARIFRGDVELSFSVASVVGFILPLLAFALMFSLLGIAASVLRGAIAFVIITAASGLTSLVFFPVEVTTLIAALLFFFGMVAWRGSVSADAGNRLKFTVVKVISSGLGGTITLVLLSVSFIYYSYLTAGGGSDRLLDGLIDTTSSSVNALLPNYIEHYKPEMTLDEFIMQSTTLDPSSLDVPVGSVIGDAVKEGIEAAQGTIIEESRTQFLRTFDIQAQGTDRMGEVVKKIISRRIEGFVKPYKAFIPAVLALSLYFILTIFRFIYVPLIQVFSFFSYRVLIAVGFLRINKVLVEREHVVLS